jgi:hypothetical protein
MPIGRDRGGRGRKGRQTTKGQVDPEGGVAYEENWYRIMARHAELGEFSGLAGERVDRRPSVAVPTSSADAPGEPGGATLVELAPKRAKRARERSAGAPSASAARAPLPTRSGASRAPRAPIHSAVRIGVRTLEDPEAVYVHYLTASPHAGFFRADWWPTGRRLTPVHLWRANHLGAGWDLDAVDRFFEGAARRVDQLLGTAPAEPPGSLARRTWVKGLLSSELTREFGLARVCKTLHPFVPELVPDLDAGMMAWARAEWLGMHAARGGSVFVDGWFETWELLEDALVLRGDVLSDIVRRVREHAPGYVPTGRLGLIAAAFWESFWQEVPRSASARTRAARPGSKSAAPPAPKPAAAASARSKAAAGTGSASAKPATADSKAKASSPRKPTTPRKRPSPGSSEADGVSSR